jgi:serine O-acetyltransferase
VIAIVERIRHQKYEKFITRTKKFYAHDETNDAQIGDRVRIYQAVTLGAKSFPRDEEGSLVNGNARHPIVEDDVVIYSGATILGRITIGRGATIGGNVWLTRSVPPGSFVSQAQLRQEIFDEGAGI